MQIELTIRANSLEDIAHIFAAKAAAYPAGYNAAKPVLADLQEPGAGKGSPEKEAAPEETTPKPRRGRKSDTAKQDTPEVSTATTEESPAGPGPSAPTAAPPSDEKVTMEDLRLAAEPIMAAGKGREIQEMLLQKFNVRAFGPLPEESYPAALAELQNLAA